MNYNSQDTAERIQHFCRFYKLPNIPEEIIKFWLESYTDGRGVEPYISNTNSDKYLFVYRQGSFFNRVVAEYIDGDPSFQYFFEGKFLDEDTMLSYLKLKSFI